MLNVAHACACSVQVFGPRRRGDGLLCIAVMARVAGRTWNREDKLNWTGGGLNVEPPEGPN